MNPQRIEHDPVQRHNPAAMSTSTDPSRREFLTVAATAAGLAATSCGASQSGGRATAPSPPQDLVGDGRKRRILLRGGVVLTLDRKVGDFEKADVLIERKDDRADRAQSLRGRCRSDRLLGHDRHARLHHHPPPSVPDDTAKHHRGWAPWRGLAARDIWIRRPEHLDGGPHRGSCRSEQDRVGPGACSVRPRGLLHLSACSLPERDQSGHHGWDGHVPGKPHARTHRRDDQGADGFRPSDGVRVFRRGQST